MQEKENIWQTFLDKLTKELPVNENFFKNAEKGKWKKILVKIFRQAKKEVSKMTTYAEKCKNFTKLKYTWRNQWMGVWCIKIQNIHPNNPQEMASEKGDNEVLCSKSK